LKLLDFKKLSILSLSPKFGNNEAKALFHRLCEAYLDMDHLQVSLEPNYKVTQKVQKQFDTAIKRLLNFEPIQYILGHTVFLGETYKVTPATLIPRPETEELVLWIASEYSGSKKINIIDIGTGSGCIGLSLKNKLPNSEVLAVDISNEALEIAKYNAQNLKLDITFKTQDILSASSLGEQQFDIVVSNPPYVRELEKAHMSRNVLEHEPSTALFVSDEDPLIYYQKIAELFVLQQHKGAALFFEINEFLSEQLRALLYEMGFNTIELKEDFRGKKRMLKVQF